MTTPTPDWLGRHRWQGHGADPGAADAALAARVIQIIEGDPALAARLHQASDVDGSPGALHHTLGLRSTEASPGDHTHDLDALRVTTRIWWSQATTSPPTIVLATAETKDDQFVDSFTGGNRGTGGDISIDWRADRFYEFIYRARFATSVAPTAADARIRITQGTPTANTDLQVAGFSVPLETATGAGAMSFECRGLVEEGAMIQSDDVRVGAFYDVTAGAGTLTVAQPSGSFRQLIVKEYITIGI